MFKVLHKDPCILENLSSEGRDFLQCCFRRNPAERPTASMVLDHPFIRNANHYNLHCSIQAFTGIKVNIVSFFLIGTWSFAAKSEENKLVNLQSTEAESGDVYLSHSCIHDEILHERQRPGRKEYSDTPQIYKESDTSRSQSRTGRTLLSISSLPILPKNSLHPIRIYLNYDAVGHSTDRDCRHVGDVVELGEPLAASVFGNLACDPHGEPLVFVDCWYNCPLEDLSGEDKKHRLRKALEPTTDWFKRALSVEPIRGSLRLSGYSACGQDGGVQLPHEYIEVTTRLTTGNTLAWAFACERDQWGRAIAGHVNVLHVI